MEPHSQTCPEPTTTPSYLPLLVTTNLTTPCATFSQCRIPYQAQPIGDSQYWTLGYKVEQVMDQIRLHNPAIVHTMRMTETLHQVCASQTITASSIINPQEIQTKTDQHGWQAKLYKETN